MESTGIPSVTHHAPTITQMDSVRYQQLANGLTPDHHYHTSHCEIVQEKKSDPAPPKKTNKQQQQKQQQQQTTTTTKNQNNVKTVILHQNSRKYNKCQTQILVKWRFSCACARVCILKNN